jgi:hypothetical protein
MGCLDQQAGAAAVEGSMGDVNVRPGSGKLSSLHKRFQITRLIRVSFQAVVQVFAIFKRRQAGL